MESMRPNPYFAAPDSRAVKERLDTAGNRELRRQLELDGPLIVQSQEKRIGRLELLSPIAQVMMEKLVVQKHLRTYRRRKQRKQNGCAAKGPIPKAIPKPPSGD